MSTPSSRSPGDRSGKSSLFNVVAGASLAEVGVRRPTTSATQAVVFGPDGATELLDWLEIQSRQYGDASAAPELSGLVLLDLPDHDSTEVSHRAKVDRLVRLVDAFIWVLDPQSTPMPFCTTNTYARLPHTVT